MGLLDAHVERLLYERVVLLVGAWAYIFAGADLVEVRVRASVSESLLFRVKHDRALLALASRTWLLVGGGAPD